MNWLTLSMSLLAVAASAADLPVKQVVLYKNGVGYFERAGEVPAGGSARLEFKASEMNDVLKSLTVEDRSGGKVSAVRYDSSEPVSRKLRDYPFTLGSEQPLTQFLDQLKGARLEVKTSGGTAAGAIVGGRVVPATRDQPEQQQITLLLDSGDLRAFDLPAAAGIRFTDPQLQQQLKEYLAVLSQGRSSDKRSVHIDSVQAGARQLAASYMVPTPVWKSSYRLILRPGGEPMLEGWAIVDNTTGEDWSGIQLALVSGRPTSFISRLYEPSYRQRPTAELPEEQARGPLLYEGAMEEAKAGVGGGGVGSGMVGGMVADAGRQRARRDAVASMAMAPPAAKAEMPAPGRFFEASSIAAAAQGRELGELFEYRFATPVTIRKGESAMLPFVQQQISARKLLIYAESYGQSPMNAAEIANGTGKTLDGGPITIFDANAYAGEALMETLKAGDKRLISYAVDLGTRVTTELDSTRDDVREVHVRRGTLFQRHVARETRTYTIRNVDPKPKTLIIEHPVRPDYKVLSPKPAETTASRHRFEVKLAAAATDKMAVVEERVYETSYAVTNLTPDVLLLYVRNKALSDAGRAQLEKILAKKQQIAGTETAMAETEKDVNEIVTDQERLRQNINSLNRVSGQQEQVQKYVSALTAQETTLVTLRDRLSELRKKKAALQSELNSLIEKMEL